MRPAVVLVASLFASSSFAVEPLGISEDEFKMYQHYRLALEDARVQAMKPALRVAAIAKDAGYKLKDLQKAVERGDAAGDLKAKCEANLKELFGKGELAGRAGKLEVDTTAAHAVAYVQWLNEKPEALTTEACFAAANATEACPIASSIQVWAQSKASPKTRVFQALISSAGAGRIKVDKVKDFAETRYLKLFEKVKSVTNGDDFTSETAQAPAAP